MNDRKIINTTYQIWSDNLGAFWEYSYFPDKESAESHLIEVIEPDRLKTINKYQELLSHHKHQSEYFEEYFLSYAFLGEVLDNWYAVKASDLRVVKVETVISRPEE